MLKTFSGHSQGILQRIHKHHDSNFKVSKIDAYSVINEVIG